MNHFTGDLGVSERVKLHEDWYYLQAASSSQSYPALNHQNNSGQALRLPAGAQHMRGLGEVWNSTGGEVGIHRRC
jgi:hypothetical protein